MSRGYYTYMVSCSDGTLYTGWTMDPERRVRVHNAGRGARYTKSRRPVCLVYLERHPSCAEAMRRERAIKGMTHEAKLNLVAQASGRSPDGADESIPGEWSR